MLDKTPLELAEERALLREEIDTCDQCEYVRPVGYSIYCGISGKLLLPLMFHHGAGSGPARRCKKRKEAISMGLTAADISRLGPAARKQIMDKLGEQARREAEAAREVKTKYHNVPAERNADDGKKIKFQSQKEARRYDELLLLLRAGEIRGLKLQPQFTLQESYLTPTGERVRAIIYTADFSYDRYDPNLPCVVLEENGGHTAVGGWVPVIEDVKSKGTRTEKYKIKRKMMLEKGYTITEV